jgi:hypothetical protein
MITIETSVRINKTPDWNNRKYGKIQITSVHLAGLAKANKKHRVVLQVFEESDDLAETN